MSNHDDDLLEGVTLAEIIVNQLAFRSLNDVDHVRSETTADAVDRLTDRVRQGSLAVYLGLVRVAEAIEAHGKEERDE